MSDYILKFWPQEDVKENKTKIIESEFKKKLITGEKSELWDELVFKSGNNLRECFGPNSELTIAYFSALFVKISELDYGIEAGLEDFEYLDRKNVISVLGADGTIKEWQKMCEELEKITGDKYKGGWELL